MTESPTADLTFEAFPKIPRLKRSMIITEKIDGTNAAVGVLEDGTVYAQSRKRLITPDKDNMGFARWVSEHEDELREGLGVGLHFGEWWGSGIQRTYGLENGDKRFSLFNVGRWGDDKETRPGCCHVVPLLDQYAFDSTRIDEVLAILAEHGSYAAPGFMNPEGIVIFHTQSRQMWKVTINDDSKGIAHGA